MSFNELGLHEQVLKAVEATGYTTPTQVQMQAVPAALGGGDLLVSSHTGSGKTAAFLLPTLSRMAEADPDRKPVGPRLLVLCPTRELALQVQKQAMTYGKGLRRMRSACLVGGAPFGPQFQALKVNPEVMIATPGRLMDHMERGRIDFTDLQTLVLDEADRMLDMGFIDDIEAIVSRLPATRQTLLFSATLDGVVGAMATRMTRNAQRIEIAAVAEHKADIDQRFMFADDFGHKQRLLDALLRDTAMTQALVFTATKRSADDLSENLMQAGFSAAALHGDMPQHKRNRTLQRLRDGQVQVLVATDVAARGIDVAGISHVINFDPPRQAEDYVHRIGRTGRAGRSGVAITLVGGKERGLMRDIERYTGDKLKIETIPGLEPRARVDREAPRKSNSEWHSKPRGEWQNKPRTGQFPGLGRKPEGAGFGGGARDARGAHAEPRVSRADSDVLTDPNSWKRAEPRQEPRKTWGKPAGVRSDSRGAPAGNGWGKPAAPKREANGNTWGKPAEPTQTRAPRDGLNDAHAWESRRPAPGKRDRQG